MSKLSSFVLCSRCSTTFKAASRLADTNSAADSKQTPVSRHTSLHLSCAVAMSDQWKRCLKSCMQSIRAGVINYKDAYRFSHPKSWREQKIANIQSGNFCMVSIWFCISSS